MSPGSIRIAPNQGKGGVIPCLEKVPITEPGRGGFVENQWSIYPINFTLYQFCRNFAIPDQSISALVAVARNQSPSP